MKESQGNKTQATKNSTKQTLENCKHRSIKERTERKTSRLRKENTFCLVF
jgi:hypothetical protein